MSYVVDASVGVAAARIGEPGHIESLRFLRRCLAQGQELVHPPLFSIEVAAALSRRGASATVVQRYLAPLLASPNRVAVLGPKGETIVQRLSSRRANAPVPGSGGAVTATSEALAGLSRDIADVLRALKPPLAEARPTPTP